MIPKLIFLRNTFCVPSYKMRLQEVPPVIIKVVDTVLCVARLPVPGVDQVVLCLAGHLVSHVHVVRFLSVVILD